MLSEFKDRNLSTLTVELLQAQALQLLKLADQRNH